MQVQQLIQMLYGAIGHQSITLAASPDTILSFINMGISNIWTFEWRSWSFKFLFNEEFTTTNTGNEYLYTIQNSTTYWIERVNSVTAYVNWKELNLNAFERRNDWRVTKPNEIFYEMHRPVLKVFDDAGAPITYNISYLRTFKQLTSQTDEIPLPEVFIPALYFLVISYLQLPFMQLDGQQNMYNIAKDMLSDLAKADSQQITQVSYKIK